MSVTINHKNAKEILTTAFESQTDVDDEITQKIKDILNGTHKTYKYVLITGLVAKATNAKADAKALQAGSELKGSYDARSLCHKVIVEFERDHLKKVLGGSNEPFLNKPARFKQLSLTNAVRSGRDTETLTSLINVFDGIETASQSKQYLTFSMQLLKVQMQQLAQRFSSTAVEPSKSIEIEEFIHRLISVSMEGESSVIAIGAIEKYTHQQTGKAVEVVAHKVNQSGASSKEIGDIDVFSSGEFAYSIEVKDKDFTEYDVQHAFDKVLNAGGRKAIFIYGPQASYDNEAIQKLQASYNDKGLYTYVGDIFQYIRLLFVRNESDFAGFFDLILETAKDVNCKQVTLDWVHKNLAIYTGTGLS